MSATVEKPNEIALDMLREVGNIGAGNAMTALATMVNRKVGMSVPHVGIVQLSDFAQMTGGAEALAVAVYMQVDGDAPGHVAFLWSFAHACLLVDAVLQREDGTTQQLDELERSVLMEVGNILASSHLVATCELTGLELFSSPPGIAIDMTAAILSTIASAFASMEDHAVTIASHIGHGANVVEGYFLFIPESGSLNIMLRALNMDI